MVHNAGSPANPEISKQPLEDRIRQAEAAIEALRDHIAGIEREVGIARADLERFRVEAERAAGAKLR